MSRPRSVALPWYAAERYEALRQSLSDGDKLPARYEAWRISTEQVEREVQRSGVDVVRVPIEPTTPRLGARSQAYRLTVPHGSGTLPKLWRLEAAMSGRTRQEAPMRELYASSNGDRWELVVDASSGHTFVRHTANEPSGGNVVDMALWTFLSRDRSGPEHQALWALIRTLVAWPDDRSPCT